MSPRPQPPKSHWWCSLDAATRRRKVGAMSSPTVLRVTTCPVCSHIQLTAKPLALAECDKCAGTYYAPSVLHFILDASGHAPALN